MIFEYISIKIRVLLFLLCLDDILRIEYVFWTISHGFNPRGYKMKGSWGLSHWPSVYGPGTKMFEIKIETK